MKYTLHTHKMSELFFAKSFLSSVQAYSTKLSPDFIEDPRKCGRKMLTNMRQFNLPKHTQTLPQKRKLSPGSKPCLSVHLKSQRNPPIEHTLQSQALTTSILDIKTALSLEIHIPVEKIKLLHKKKPVPDSKILKDLVDIDFDENEDNAGTESIVELCVMVLGGAGLGAPKHEKPEISKTSGISKGVVEANQEENPLKTEKFWSDLNEFLLQRLNNEREREMVFNTFRKAIQSQTSYHQARYKTSE